MLWLRGLRVQELLLLLIELLHQLPLEFELARDVALLRWLSLELAELVQLLLSLCDLLIGQLLLLGFDLLLELGALSAYPVAAGARCDGIEERSWWLLRLELERLLLRLKCSRLRSWWQCWLVWLAEKPLS